MFVHLQITRNPLTISPSTSATLDRCQWCRDAGKKTVDEMITYVEICLFLRGQTEVVEPLGWNAD
jgi:hypothetical protein